MEEVEEGGAFLHIPFRMDSGWTRANGEGSKVEGWRREEGWSGEERRGQSGFCLLPTFQSQS